MGPEVAILRCEKIKNLAGLGARDAHNRRKKTVENADPKRRLQNLNLRPDLPVSASEAFDGVYGRLGRPKLRKNGVIGIEYLGAVPSQASSRIDIIDFARRVLAFVVARHGAENVLSAHLHLDEKTPHVHIIVAPVFAGAFVVGPFMGSRGALRKLQDDFFEQVSSRYGFARRTGNATGRAHIPMRVLRAQSRDAAAPIDEAQRRLEAIGVDTSIQISTEPVSTLSLLSERGRDAFVDSVERAAKSRIIAIREQILRVAAASLDELRELAASAALLRAENNAMKRHQIELMRDIPLDRVTELYLGVSPHREGSSLVAETDDHKIVITGPKFKDFKGNQGSLGGGAIDLAMHLLGCDFKRAIEVLASDFPDFVAGAVRNHYLRRADEETAVAKAAPRRPSFEEQFARFAQPESARLPVVRKYLNEERMIPLPLIDQLIERGDLWANKWGSCVFAHRDLVGGIRGCTIRGTTGVFKQVLGSKRDAWFSLGTSLVEASRLVLTESPVDALSYEALGLRGARDAVLSTAGQADYEPFLEFGRPLVLAQDADDSGECQAHEIESPALISGLRVERHTPARGKDWNEQLTYDRNQQRHAAREMAERENAIARTLGASSQGDRTPSRGGPNTGVPGFGESPDTPRRGPVH